MQFPIAIRRVYVPLVFLKDSRGHLSADEEQQVNTLGQISTPRLANGLMNTVAQILLARLDGNQ